MLREFIVIVFIGILLISCKVEEDKQNVSPKPTLPEREIAYPPEMEQFRENYEKSGIEYVSVGATPGKTKPWQSKFLGIPYLLKDDQYPVGIDDRPLQLLAQINFEEIPRLDGYPQTGILQFFISPYISNDHAWGLYFPPEEEWNSETYFKSLVEQKYFRVRYHETIIKDSDKLVTRMPSFSDGHLPIDQEAELTFELNRGYVTNDDYRFKKYFGSDAYAFFDQFLEVSYEVGNQYFKFTYPEGQAWIGGYGIFTQVDPREGDEDWLILLEIDSTTENGLGILWGDVGIGVFFIRKNDLENRDFSNVMYYWDNH